MCVLFFESAHLLFFGKCEILSLLYTKRIDKQDKLKNINRQGSKLRGKIGCLDLHVSKFFSTCFAHHNPLSFCLSVCICYNIT